MYIVCMKLGCYYQGISSHFAHRQGLLVTQYVTQAHWHLSMFSMKTCERISLSISWLQTLYRAEDDLELPFLPLPPKCWDCRCGPPCQVYRVLGIVPGAWCMLGKCSNSATSSALTILSTTYCFPSRRLQSVSLIHPYFLTTQQPISFWNKL